MQTRTHSLVESVSNVAIGYFVALASQIAIFPMFGVHLPLAVNAECWRRPKTEPLLRVVPTQN